jgi:ribonuclease P protein component
LPPLLQQHRCRQYQQKSRTHETHIPTQRDQAQAHSRIPRPHEDRGRPSYTGCAPCQGPSSFGRLILAFARCGLSKSYRLLKPAEFKVTLKSSTRWRDDFFGVYATPNPYPYGRLGIVVSRKTSPRAVVRNRVKRQIRESFRCQKEKFGGLDIVVVAGPRAGTGQSIALRTSLQQIWDKVEKQCRKSS